MIYALRLVVLALVVAAWAIGAGLSAIRALAAKVKCVLLRLLTCPRVDHELTYRYPAIVAGVGAIIPILTCCREGISRSGYPLGVHSLFPFLWAGSRGVATPAGPFPFQQLHYTAFIRHLQAN